MTRHAVFLDRDGVINHNWYNPETGEWESPIRPQDFCLREGVTEALKTLVGQGFQLYLVSNQPSAAKGKCTLEDLAAVHRHFAGELDKAGIAFADFYYSYTHPEGVVAMLSGPDPRRKPSPYFVDAAIEQHQLDRAACWMVGDRDTDIECGVRAGVRTIQVRSSEPDGKSGNARSDFTADDLAGAARIIIGVGR